MSKKLAPKPTNDPAEIARMVDFYAAQNAEVYLLHCLNCKLVIGVEVGSHKADALNTDRGRGFYNYRDRTLSVRQRLDSHPGGRMIGYQCACGNNTTLAAVERGEVPQTTVLVDKLSGEKVGQTAPIPSSSPFEMAQIQATVQLKQASGVKADYELTGNIERFESFQLERVK